MGGAQSLHVNSFDEVLAIPTEFSASLSVKTQQIILHETGIASVVDPLGGSYYVEWLTDRLEEEAQKIIETIQAKGGAFKAWDWMSNEVREAACRWQKDFDDGKRILVGVNAFVAPNDLQTKALQILQEHADFEVLYEYESSIRDKQIARLEKVRRERDNEKVEKAKKRLQEAFQSGENIVPPLIEAVKAYLSQGEVAQICGAKGFGEFRYMLG
jgi:methylmalonyl-CoA mutase N-terminal domain/subunit